MSQSPDPILQLAIAMYHNPGAYALLLGSGTSRSAGIPTGWDIVREIIQELSVATEGKRQEDPEAWYRETFGKKPRYDELLDLVSGFVVERSALIRGLIEPTEEDIESGIKVPQAAHRAIARLVAGGYVRVIITTNFDRLLEEALAEIHVVPTVISSRDSIKGALPLVQSRCTIIKVHGDYVDSRVRNTPAELAEYDQDMNRLLSRVFEDFGLVVCGWSSQWDPALRLLASEHVNRYYGTFWAVRSDTATEPAEAHSSVAARGGTMVSTGDADSFYVQLEEKVAALEQLVGRQPLTAAVAAATMKRYLGEPTTNRIRVHDLVLAETDRLIAHLRAGPQLLDTNREEAPSLTEGARDACRVPIALFVTGCYWGQDTQTGPWDLALAHLLESCERTEEFLWFGLWGYCTAILLYAGGIAAVAATNYRTLRDILLSRREMPRNRRDSLVLRYGSYVDRLNDTAGLASGIWSRELRLSDHMYDVLRGPLIEYLPRPWDYDDCFNRFEYLTALTYLYEADQRDISSGSWGPLGRFYSERHRPPGERFIDRIGEEAAVAEDAWPPLRAGLFGGRYEEFMRVKRSFDGRFFLGTG